MGETIDGDDKFTFKADTQYEITINPDDKHQFYGKGHTRVNYFVEAMAKELDQWKESCAYSMALEVSMPQYGNATRGSKPRLHYHGVIRFKDEVSIATFFIERAYKVRQWCDVQFNEFRPEHWPKYCAKNKAMMKSYCDAHHVPYIQNSEKAPYSIRKVYVDKG